MCPQIWEFVPIAEALEWRFLSYTAAARLPAQQPKTWSAFAMRGRYAVLGSIYYGRVKLLSSAVPPQSSYTYLHSSPISHTFHQAWMNLEPLKQVFPNRQDNGSKWAWAVVGISWFWYMLTFSILFCRVRSAIQKKEETICELQRNCDQALAECQHLETLLARQTKQNYLGPNSAKVSSKHGRK